MLVFIQVLVLVFVGANCAPIDEEAAVEVPIEIVPIETLETATILEDTSAKPTEKNQVQEFFENLSKEASTNSEKALNSLKDFISKASPASNSRQVNLPEMYMGSFQLLKMPMPQFTDIANGLGNMATAAQAINKLTGLSQGLPIPGLSKT